MDLEKGGKLGGFFPLLYSVFPLRSIQPPYGGRRKRERGKGKKKLIGGELLKLRGFIYFFFFYSDSKKLKGNTEKLY